MSVAVLREDLLNGLSDVETLFKKSSPLPALSHVHMKVKNDYLVLMATDLDLWVRTIVSADVFDYDMKSICIPGERLVELTKAMPRKSTLSLKSADNGMNLIVSGDKGEFEIQCLKGEDFPRFPDSDADSEENVIIHDMLSEMFTKTAPFVSRDKSREAMQGLFWKFDDGSTTMAAANGQGTAKAKVFAKNLVGVEEGRTLPVLAFSTAVKTFKGASDITVRFGTNYVYMKTKTKSILCRVLSGVFPDYNRVLSLDFDKTLIVDRDAFISALRRTKVVASKANSLIAIRFRENDPIMLSASTMDVGKGREPVEATFDGEEIIFNISCQTAMTYLNALAKGDVKITMSHLRMPFQLSNVEKRDGFEYASAFMPLQFVHDGGLS